MRFIAEQRFFSNYELNNFKTRKIRNKILIINDSGSWVALYKHEYVGLMGHHLDEKLFFNLLEKGIIVTENNINQLAENYRKKKCHLFQGTSLHIVVVTLRCNQICVYCHSASKHVCHKEYDMNEKTAKKTVDFIFQTPSKAITIEFQGGEPLLNFRNVKYIVDYANKVNKKHKKDLKFSIVTNLTLMNEKILKFLEKNKVGICTSLDGPKIVHDKNRRFLNGRGSYDSVTKWIKQIQKRKKLGLNALMVTTRYSLNYPEEIFQEYQCLGLNKIWFRSLNNLGYALNIWKKISYTAEEYLEFWRKAMDIIYSQDKLKEILSTFMLIKILTNKEPMYLDLMSPCGAAIGQLAYHYNGDIYSCDEGRMVGDDLFKLGNLFEDDYKTVVCSDKTCDLIASSINDTYLCDVCVYQAYCGLCPVNCYVATGNIIPKLSIDLRCKILKGQFDYLFEKIIFDKNFDEIVRKGSTKLKNPFYIE